MRSFITTVAEFLNIHLRWEGNGIKEKGYDQDGRLIVIVDPKYFRPTEVDTLLGDSSKAKAFKLDSRSFI